jgi:hypothetical protein
MARRALLLLLLAFVLPAPGVTAAPPGSGVLVVHLADGTSIPLSSWTLSYEFQAWKSGTPPGFTQPERRNVTEIWIGKKTYPLSATSLEIEYRVYERQVEVNGETHKAPGAVVTKLVVMEDGKRKELKPDPPDKELLLPDGAHKGMLLQPRSLDVRGETLTGTRRDFCAMSYSPLVECNAAASARIVKLELQR